MDAQKYRKILRFATISRGKWQAVGENGKIDM